MVIMFGLFFSCKTTKYVPKGNYLLTKVRIKYDNLRLPPDELYANIQQKPNKRILGVPFYLLAYNTFHSEKKIQRIVGEPPVIYDSIYTQKTLKSLDAYLNKKGYFKHKVTYRKIINKKQNKIKLEYRIEVDKPYKIKHYEIDFNNSPLQQFSQLLIPNSYIKEGDIFDVDKLDEERTRITNFLKNEGYFNFSKDYIGFKVDSSNFKVDVKAIIKPSALRNKKAFKKYYINNVTVVFKNSNFAKYPVDTIEHHGVIFINSKNSPVKINTVYNQLYLKSGNLYMQQHHTGTYKMLARLQVFKVININFDEKNDSLNVVITLDYGYLKRFSAEIVATNNSSNLGINGTIGYKNKNIFKHAEILTFNLSGGVSVQPLLNTQQNQYIFDYLPFNTIMITPQLKLQIPAFLLPVRASKFSINNAPVTVFNLDYNYQKRPDYERYWANFSFGYKWNETKFKYHQFNPVEINYIQLNPSSDFANTLQNLNDPFLINSYQDQFIPAMSYDFFLNNKTSKRDPQFQFLNLHVESAGNLLYWYSEATNQPKTDNYYTYYSVRFSQYVLGSIDFSNYFTSKHTAFVQHFFSGIGVPYNNSSTLPFVKSFFAGGTNGMRGWSARTLGPGSLSDSLAVSVVDQIGNVKLVTNLEYRFDVIKYLEMALFVDAGNIWLLHKDANRPGAELSAEKFFTDIAIDAGVGIRLDFDFFLIRFDFATKVKNPAKPIGNQFDVKLKNTVLNLGVGYPF